MHEFDKYLHNLQTALRLSPHRAKEICDEIRSHLEARTVQWEKAGLNHEDAVIAAMRSFGEPETMAKHLLQANKVHQTPLALYAALLGFILGSCVYYCSMIVLYLLHITSIWSLTAYWYHCTFMGGIPGIICSLVIVKWRIRFWTIAIALAAFVTALCSFWFCYLYTIRSFTDFNDALNSFKSVILGIPTIYITMVFIINAAIHRWVLRGTNVASLSPQRNSVSRKAGFTLVELLIVIGIIGVLTSIVFTVFSLARSSAKQTECLSNLHQIGLAFRMYMEDYDRRPPNLDALAVGGYADPKIFICPKDPTGNHGGLIWSEVYPEKKPLAVPISYVYPQGLWIGEYSWERLMKLVPSAPIVVCQTHGDILWKSSGHHGIGSYEGKVLRLYLDGSVHVGHVTWARGPNWTQFNLWKLLTGSPGEFPFDDRSPV